MRGLEWLNQVFEIEHRIECLETRRDYLVSALTGGGNKIREMPRNSESNKNRTEELLIKKMEIDERIENEKQELLKFKDELSRILKTLKADEEMVLSLRYLDGLSWAEIAEHTGKEIRNVYRIRERAERKMSEG